MKLSEILKDVELTEEQLSKVNLEQEVFNTSDIDKRVNDGIETFKTKGMLKILAEKEEAIRSEYKEPVKSPEMIEIEKLRKQLEEKDTAEKLVLRQAELTGRLSTLGLPTDLAEKLVTVESSDAIIDSIYNIVNGKADSLAKDKVTSLIKQQPTEASVKNTNLMTQEAFDALPVDKKVEFLDNGGDIK